MSESRIFEWNYQLLRYLLFSHFKVESRYGPLPPGDPLSSPVGQGGHLFGRHFPDSYRAGGDDDSAQSAERMQKVLDSNVDQITTVRISWSRYSTSSVHIKKTPLITIKINVKEVSNHCIDIRDRCKNLSNLSLSLGWLIDSWWQIWRMDGNWTIENYGIMPVNLVSQTLTHQMFDRWCLTCRNFAYFCS